jgi:hypothetical protein
MIMNNDLWYVLVHHWDDDCEDWADVKFFPSAKTATDYAMEQRDKFRTIYESDNYGIEILSDLSNAAYCETCVKVTVTYQGSDAIAACEQYKIGEVRVSV